MIKIEVKKYVHHQEFFRNGFVTVELGGMIELQCEVCFQKNKDIWIKLPVRQHGIPGQTNTVSFVNTVYFNSEGFSKHFQKTVIEQLTEKYPESIIPPPKRLPGIKKDKNSFKGNKKPFNKKPFKSSMSGYDAGASTSRPIRDPSSYRDVVPLKSRKFGR